MNLNDLLRGEAVDPERVVVLRHRPSDPALRKALPWLAAERPEVFNAYQQAQGERLERVLHGMVGGGLVASFIGTQPGRALFVGLYAIRGARTMTDAQLRKVPALVEVARLTKRGWVEKEGGGTTVFFDLALTDALARWKGRLVVSWPPPELSWWRRAHRNDMPVHAIHEDSVLVAAMPAWDELVLTWEELRALPSGWRAALAQWRGVYFIFDTSDGKGYVGSASGADNLLGRWLGYAASGHGGNRLLRGRDPTNFRFSVLQRVSPDLPADDVVRLEATWKQRLHTREPFGLNDN